MCVCVSISRCVRVYEHVSVRVHMCTCMSMIPLPHSLSCRPMFCSCCAASFCAPSDANARRRCLACHPTCGWGTCCPQSPCTSLPRASDREQHGVMGGGADVGAGVLVQANSACACHNLTQLKHCHATCFMTNKHYHQAVILPNITTRAL